MDKKTILAVVLSVAIISVTFAIQAIFFPNAFSPGGGTTTEPAETSEEQWMSDGSSQSSTTSGQEIRAVSEVSETLTAKNVGFTTNVFEGTFSTLGGNLTSLKLNLFKENDGSKVDMVMSADSGEYPFNLYLGDYDTGRDVFEYTRGLLPNEWQFSRRYAFNRLGREIPFTLTKKYTLKNNEYLMEVRVIITTDEEEEEKIPVEDYTLTYGPQIGPRYSKLDNRTAYRHFIYYAEGKRKDHTGKVKTTKLDLSDRASWLAVEGKYFVAIGISYISDLSSFLYGFDSTRLTGLRDHHGLYFERAIKKSVKIDDGYKFYMGPKKKEILERYNDREQNQFEESGLHLEHAVPSDFWGWLSSILKWMLELFYSLIPNWGVAIIMLTIVIKIIFFPLTHKSFESTRKMQALGPKIEELKQRFKNNSQKLNQEMAALYKREGVNPIGGCLPMLLQLPIFFALYHLFSNYFELRGAAFLPPWIGDLSSPETILTLPFTIPFLGADLRLLPFIMLGTTFIQQRITQTPGQSSRQSKMLMYAMPAFFFFIMYNMPSGLLLYWTMQNLFTFITQFYFNNKKKKQTQ